MIALYDFSVDLGKGAILLSVLYLAGLIAYSALKGGD